MPMVSLNLKVNMEKQNISKSIKNLPDNEKINNFFGKFFISIISEFLKFK